MLNASRPEKYENLFVSNTWHLFLGKTPSPGVTPLGRERFLLLFVYHSNMGQEYSYGWHIFHIIQIASLSHPLAIFAICYIYLLVMVSKGKRKQIARKTEMSDHFCKCCVHSWHSVKCSELPDLMYTVHLSTFDGKANLSCWGFLAGLQTFHPFLPLSFPLSIPGLWNISS